MPCSPARRREKATTAASHKPAKNHHAPALPPRAHHISPNGLCERGSRVDHGFVDGQPAPLWCIRWSVISHMQGMGALRMHREQEGDLFRSHPASCEVGLPQLVGKSPPLLSSEAQFERRGPPSHTPGAQPARAVVTTPSTPCCSIPLSPCRPQARPVAATSVAASHRRGGAPLAGPGRVGGDACGTRGSSQCSAHAMWPC